MTCDCPATDIPKSLSTNLSNPGKNSDEVFSALNLCITCFYNNSGKGLRFLQKGKVLSGHIGELLSEKSCANKGTF